MRELRTGAALVCLDRWLELEPRTARALHWRGRTLERLHQMDKAIADFQQALELDPRRWGCRLRLSRLLLDRHNAEEALPHLEELQRGHPDDPEVLVALAQCRQLQGEELQALQLLDQTLASHPNFFDALVLRGQLGCQQQEPAEGEIWLRRRWPSIHWTAARFTCSTSAWSIRASKAKPPRSWLATKPSRPILCA